jgi:hypothetical protein
MTSAIKTAATRVLTDSELDAVAGGVFSDCKPGERYTALGCYAPPPPPPPPPPPVKLI